jgi:hypothetical protein
VSAFPPGRVPVLLLAWGLTEADTAMAVKCAEQRPSRVAWEFVHIDKLTDGACPIDISDPKVIAADCSSGWAYAVYPACDRG